MSIVDELEQTLRDHQMTTHRGVSGCGCGADHDADVGPFSTWHRRHVAAVVAASHFAGSLWLEHEHAVNYQSAEGTTVRVVMPWPLGVGIIPPPEVTFRHSSFNATVFVYAGTA